MSPTIGPNSLAGTESNPYGMFPTVADVEAWGIVHKSINDAVKAQLGAPGAGEFASYDSASNWSLAGQKYSDTADLGIMDIAEFGIMDMDDLIAQIIADGKEGARLLGELRSQAGVPGGSDVGGSTGTGEPTGWAKDVRVFVAGGVLAAIGVYYFSQKD